MLESLPVLVDLNGRPWGKGSRFCAFDFAAIYCQPLRYHLLDVSSPLLLELAPAFALPTTFVSLPGCSLVCDFGVFFESFGECAGRRVTMACLGDGGQQVAVLVAGQCFFHEFYIDGKRINKASCKQRSQPHLAPPITPGLYPHHLYKADL